MDQIKGCRQHADASGGAGKAGGFGFGTDINHVGLTGGIEMGERGVL